MMSRCIVLSFAVVASAQLASITDMIGHNEGASSALPQTGPAQQATTDSNTFPQSGHVLSGTKSPMEAILGSPFGGPTGHITGAQPLSGQAISQDSIAVVSGLVEQFMHKVSLQDNEKACLEKNMEQITGDVMGTVGNIVVAVKALIEGKGTVQPGETGSLVSAGIDTLMKLSSLAALSTQLLQNCVHGDALDLLKTVGHHMTNGTYLERRFLVGGVDIAHSLADSIFAFEHHDFHRFGADIGVALRKVLLSTNNNATRLPEGVPDRVIIQKATEGLMKGFFVSGSAIEITDTAHPDVNMIVNLHQCIGGNSAFFKELWGAAWNLIAQLSANGLQHGLGFDPDQKGQPKWEGELMEAMMQFPMALAKCGVSADMQTMFMEAIKSLKDVHVAFKIPVDGTDATDAAERMAKAVEAWSSWDFEGFGFQLGTLFRELVMLGFPQQYSMDASGRLQRYSQTQITTAQKSARVVTSSTVIIGGAAVSVLVTVAVARARRAVPKMLADSELLTSDVEDGHDIVVE